MSDLVNNIPTSPDAYGIVNGTAGRDRISGTSGTDHLRGGHGVDALFGGAGNDAFVFAESDWDVSLGNAVQDFVLDFAGAGGYKAGDNDFLAFTGFGAGSTFTFDVAKSALAAAANGGDTTLQYYSIHSANTGHDYTLFVHSLDSQVLTHSGGDFAFY